MIKQKCRKPGISPCCHNKENCLHTKSISYFIYAKCTIIKTYFNSGVQLQQEPFCSQQKKACFKNTQDYFPILLGFFLTKRLFDCRENGNRRIKKLHYQTALNCFRSNTHLIFSACRKLLKTGK